MKDIRGKTIKDVIKIDGEANLVRDRYSKAVLSNDVDGLEAYRLQRIQRNKVAEYENDINTLKTEITEIRNTLELLVKKFK